MALKYAGLIELGVASGDSATVPVWVPTRYLRVIVRVEFRAFLQMIEWCTWRECNCVFQSAASRNKLPQQLYPRSACQCRPPGWTNRGASMCRGLWRTLPRWSQRHVHRLQIRQRRLQNFLETVAYHLLYFINCNTVSRLQVSSCNIATSLRLHIPTMAKSQRITKLPLIPLATDTVLLPGNGLRIPFAASRPDIPALLSQVYSTTAGKTSTQRFDAVHVICVPLNSPLLSKNGQRLIGDKKEKEEKELRKVEPAYAKKEDLFTWGCAAKISGVEGRGSGEFSLIVEGLSRVRISKVTQERPYFEGEVSYETDDGKHATIPNPLS